MTNTLFIDAYYQDIFDNANGIMAELLFFSATQYNGGYIEGPVVFQFGTLNTTATPYPSFPTIDAAIAYFASTSAANLINDVNSAIGSTFYTAYDVEKVPAPVLAAISAISIDSIADGSTYKKITAAEKSKVDGLATVATTGSYNDLSNKPTIPTVAARSFANPSRSLNTAFQISTTRDASVSYAVDVSAALSLSGGQTGTVSLQYADDSGFTTNVVTANDGANGNTGTLTDGLGLTQLGTVTVSGIIPTGKYVKLLTTNTTGTPTFTFRRAQEVLL